MESEELDDLVRRTFDSIPKTDMADYWVDYLHMCDALFLSTHANHSATNFQDLIDSQRAMLPWLTIYDNNQYSRWLPYFWSMLSALPANRRNFLENNFAHSLTGNPYSGQALDMLIEVTMNKGSKLKSGWLSILKNEKQLLVHSRNANNVNVIRGVVLDFIDQKKNVHKHTDSTPHRLRVDEQLIQDLLQCVEEFDCNPFDAASPTLRTLQSAIPASQKLIDDLKTAFIDGETKLQKFLDERIYSRIISFHATVERSGRLTFANDEIKTISNNKAVAAGAMEKKGLSTIIEIVEMNSDLDLCQIMENRITDECLSIFNADGTLRKVQKSKLIDRLHFEPTKLDQYIGIIDMGMIWRIATPKSDEREKADGTPYTWDDYATKIINIIFGRHLNAVTLVLVNDPYDLQYTLKDAERASRSKGQIVPRVYPKLHEKFPSATDFKRLLCSSENKSRIQNLVKNKLLITDRSNLPDIIYSCGSTAVDLKTGKEVTEFQCNQSEADTIMFSIYSAIRSHGLADHVVLDMNDTDCYVQAAAISNMLPGVLAIRRKQQFITARELCPPAIAKIIVQLHALTGNDSNNGFFGHGKRSIFDKVVKNPKYQKLLYDVGKDIPLTDSVLEQMKRFVIRAVYGDMKSYTIREARAVKWKSLKKKSTLRICPDDDSLKFLCERGNYLAYIGLHPEIKDHPSPVGNGWAVQDGSLRAIRYTKNAFFSLLSKGDCGSLLGRKPSNSVSASCSTNFESDLSSYDSESDTLSSESDSDVNPNYDVDSD